MKRPDGSFCTTLEESLNCLLHVYFLGSLGQPMDEEPTFRELRRRDFCNDKVGFIMIDKIKGLLMT